MGKRENQGRGVDIPPIRQQVMIWFLQRSRPEQEATSFYRFYQKAKWKGLSGTPIKDWKIAAWNWIWNKRKQ